MTTIRQQRVAELLFEELSIMIASELNDPRLSLVQVTSVDVSRDLRNVKVYVSHDDDEVSKRQVLQGLQHALPYLRRQIAVRCTLRAVPEFAFYYDDTPERAARVDALLRAIAEARAADVQGDPNTPPTAPTAPPAA
jgi:ribosome-binding factor A